MESTCVVEYCRFLSFSSTVNGGVLLITKNIPLDVTKVVFKECSSTGSGGGIYYGATSKFKMRSIFAEKCSAISGFCVYSAGSESVVSQTDMNNTASTGCFSTTTGQAVFAMTYTSLLSKDYNSSKCQANSGCNVHSWYNKKSTSSFYILYNNNLCYLYGMNTHSSENKISYLSLIENKCDVNGDATGLLHTGSYSDNVLTVDKMIAFKNTHTLFNAVYGTIIVLSLECDHFSSRGNAVNKANVIEGKTLNNFSFTLKAVKFACNPTPIMMKNKALANCFQFVFNVFLLNY